MNKHQIYISTFVSSRDPYIGGGSWAKSTYVHPIDMEFLLMITEKKGVTHFGGLIA